MAILDAVLQRWNHWILQALEQTLFDLTEEYPGKAFKWAAADQDVINRYMGQHYNDECDDVVGRDNNCSNSPIDLIPCDWACDWNSCRFAKSDAMPPQCSTCQNIDRCRVFHFLTGAYNSKALDSWSGDETLNWNFYNQLDSLQVLDQFVQRISERRRESSTGLSSAQY